MLEKEFTYIHKEKEYLVKVKRKRMKSIRYTFKDGVFHVSAPYFFASKKDILNGLDKFAEKLIEGDKRGKASGDNYLYLLGEKKEIGESGELLINNECILIYKDKDDLEKKLRKWFLNLLIERTRYYENLMNIEKPYKVRVKKMSSRYGSNSLSTHALSFSTILMHYSLDVIDSVVVHELAHHFVRNHSNNFYKVVYQYCPNYNNLHRRLRKGLFS